jgi:hypothetical protein
VLAFVFPAQAASRWANTVDYGDCWLFRGPIMLEVTLDPREATFEGPAGIELCGTQVGQRVFFVGDAVYVLNDRDVQVTDCGPRPANPATTPTPSTTPASAPTTVAAGPGVPSTDLAGPG